VNVADDVKRAAVAFAIVPQRLSLDFHRVDFLWGTEDVNVAKSFAIEISERFPQTLDVPPNYVISKVAVWTLLIAIGTQFFW
jgi:hypothetical protein